MTAPVVRLILAEHPLPGFSATAGTHPLRAGVTAVYARPDGTVEGLGRPLKVGEATYRRYRTRYDVGLADHEFVLAMPNELPTRDEAFRFDAQVHLGFRVHDAAEVVRRRITDGLGVTRSRLLDTMRRVSRRYRIRECERAEDEINDKLGRGIRLDEGITVYRFSAFLSLDHATRKADDDLRTAQHDATLENDRMTAVQQAMDGHLGLLRLHLARHPDTTHQVLEMVARADQSSVQARLDLLKSMMDANLIQDIDIEDIRDDTLRSLLSAVKSNGSGLLTLSNPAAAALAAQPVQAPPSVITGQITGVPAQHAPQPPHPAQPPTGTPGANRHAPSSPAAPDPGGANGTHGGPQPHGANVTAMKQRRRPGPLDDGSGG